MTRRGYDDITDMQLTAEKVNIWRAQDLAPHAQAVLRMIADGQPLSGIERYGDCEQYKEQFNLLLKRGYVEFDGWIPKLTDSGEFACKHCGIGGASE